MSGPAAKGYLDQRVFAERGITVRWKSYAGYPAYEQPEPPFEHGVSVIDLLCCTGDAAPKYLRSTDCFEP